MPNPMTPIDRLLLDTGVLHRVAQFGETALRDEGLGGQSPETEPTVIAMKTMAWKLADNCRDLAKQVEAFRNHLHEFKEREAAPSQEDPTCHHPC